MSFLKHQTLIQLQHVAAYSRRRMNDYKMKAEAAEEEIAKRQKELSIDPEASRSLTADEAHT